MPNNYYRLLRVLEIVQRTGRRMSELDIDEVRSISVYTCPQMQQISFVSERQISCGCQSHPKSRSCDQAAPLDFDFRPFFLHRRREHLYRRIDARCEEMVQRGLLQVMLVMLKCIAQLTSHSASLLNLQRRR